MKVTNLLFTAVLYGAAAAAASPESSIEENTARWEAAFAAGDTRALAGMYAEDAVVVPPSLEIVTEPEAIGTFWAEKMGAGTRDFRVDTINLRVDGDRVYQTAVWSAAVEGRGKVNRFDGEMTNVFQRQPDGTWKIHVQNWY